VGETEEENETKRNGYTTQRLDKKIRNELRADIWQSIRESLGDDPLEGLVIKPLTAKDRRLMKKAKDLGEKK